MHTGTARGEIRRTGAHERGTELLGGRQRRHLQRRLRRLVGHTEVAATVAIISPTWRVGSLIRDARQGEGVAADRGDVATGAREDDRMVRRYRISIVTVRMASLAQARLVVASSANPRPRRLGRRALVHRFL